MDDQPDRKARFGQALRRVWPQRYDTRPTNGLLRRPSPQPSKHPRNAPSAHRDPESHATTRKFAAKLWAEAEAVPVQYSTDPAEQPSG